MAPPRRARPQARSSARLASFLFLVGCLVVLGVTFVLGVAAGRRWPNGIPGLRWSQAVTAAAPAQPERRAETKSESRPMAKPVTEAPPLLTFYHELTAPLASPPSPPVKPAAKPPARVAETPKPAPREARSESREAPKLVASERADGRFTVQVGAFKSRAPADALRARLSAGGQDVSVTELQTEGGTQYRVRVGSFATREAAQQAATRLADERQIATYVTTR